MRIDAHQHYWRIDAPGHEWPTADLPILYRDFLPADLDPHRAACGIQATIAVQSQPTDADTDWLLDLAGQTPSIAAVVGWADLKAETAARRVAELSRHPKLRGLRPMLQDLAPDWILDPAVDPAVAQMIAHGLVFDALIRPHHLSAIAAFARTHPDLTIVIDHAAKPEIAAGHRQEWRAEMAKLAALPNVACKLSGLLTEAVPDWRAEDVGVYVADILSLFSAQRVIWGSDWPVLLLRSDYATWHDLAQALYSSLSDEDRNAIFGGNARRLYGIVDS